MGCESVGVITRQLLPSKDSVVRVRHVFPNRTPLPHSHATREAGRYTGGNETLCLDPASGPLVDNQNLRSAVFEDGIGNKMACLQCWGQHCEEFHASTPVG